MNKMLILKTVTSRVVRCQQMSIKGKGGWWKKGNKEEQKYTSRLIR